MEPGAIEHIGPARMSDAQVARMATKTLRRARPWGTWARGWTHKWPTAGHQLLTRPRRNIRSSTIAGEGERNQSSHSRYSYPMASSQEANFEDASEDSGLANSHPMLALGKPDAAFVEVVEEVRKRKIFAGLGLMPQEIPERFGRYSVLDVVGQGGMGNVFTAYDKELDRAVAIKVLRSDLAESDGLRLKREAQALAKLSHPNVIHVYEVGEVDGQTFVAMELVKRGQTLAKWVRSEPRPSWRECVEVYLQAGTGLAAAHAEGLVHRDFKPSNVVIDDKGLVRVLDFGLARQVAGTTSTPRETLPVVLSVERTALETSMTPSGMVMGTPAYMAPEQLEGGLVDARSDQFSYCVSLWEAVYGVRPYRDNVVGDRLLSVASIPDGPKIPIKLRELLLRGLSVDPDQRWPSMDALLSALRQFVAPRRRWLMVGFFGALVAVGVGLGIPKYVEIRDRCTGAEKALAGVWDDSRKREVRSAILGTQLPYAPDAWGRVESMLDGVAQAWTNKHTEICLQTSVWKDQGDREHSLRMNCLREYRASLDVVVMQLTQIDDEGVANAVDLAANLQDLSRCDDVHLLHWQSQRKLSSSMDVTGEVARLSRRMSDIIAVFEMGKSGKSAEALRDLESVLGQIEATGNMPLLISAKAWQGIMVGSEGSFSDAEVILKEAHALSIEHLYHEGTFLSAMGLAMNMSTQGRFEEGLVWAETAWPMAKRLGHNVRYIGASVMANLLSGQGRYEDAETLLRQEISLCIRNLGSGHSVVATLKTMLGHVLGSQGKFQEAELEFRDALGVWEGLLWKEHPYMVEGLLALGRVLEEQGKYGAAEIEYRRLLEVILQSVDMDDLTAADHVTDLANVLRMQGKYEDAEKELRRAEELRARALGDDSRGAVIEIFPE